MHQLLGVMKAPRLNQEILEAKLKEMLLTATEQNKNKPNGDTQTRLYTEKVRIEFLYFKERPSYKQVLANLRAALLEMCTKADSIFINVDSPEKAEKIGFHGSPSIIINGKDLEGRKEYLNYSCRLYSVNGKSTTVPSKDFIVEKLGAQVRFHKRFRVKCDEKTA
jgi:hypothetical protein